MRLLLDTHALLWWLGDDTRLSARARESIIDPRSRTWVSSISVAEIAIKSAVGKLTIPVDFLDHVGPAGFRDLPFTHTDAEALRALPLHHRDPFDRMLIVQARAEGLTLVSSNPRFSLYEVNVLAAS